MSEPKKKQVLWRATSENHEKEKKIPKNVLRVQSMRTGSAKSVNLTKRGHSVSAIEELIQCGICLDKLKEPRMLPCQHTFCLSCLQSHIIAKTIKLKETYTNEETVPTLYCPFCQAKVALENGIHSLETLPRNLHVDNLLRFVQDQTPNMIDLPERRCVKCQTVSNLQEQICQHCLQVLCKICWMEHVQEIQNKLPVLIKQLGESEMRLEHKLDSYESRCNQLNEIIRTTAEDKIKEIRDLEAATLKEVEKIKQNKENSCKDIKQRLLDMKKNIENSNLDAVAKETNKVAALMELHAKTSELLEEVLHWDESRIIFDAMTFKLEQETEGIYDELENSEITNDAIRIVQNPLESVDSMIAHYKNRHFSAKLVWKKCPRPAGVGIPPWKRNYLYVASTDSHVVSILNKTEMKLVGRLTSPEMLCPIGLAFSEQREEIYVSDKWKHCIHVFAKNGEYLRMICSKGSTEGRLRTPEGIALNSKDQLVICDTGNDRIVILNPENGKQIATLGITKNQRTELNAPTGVAVFNNLIIIADSGNHRIKIFEENGLKIRDIGSLGRNSGNFRSPEVVAVDPMGLILIGDAGNARIQIFKPDGCLVRTFGISKNNIEKFKWISGIMVTPQLEIIVTDSRNRSLQIF